MRARWLVLAILGSSTASAEPSDLSIWYRSSDGCPTADAFVERLNQLGRHTSLAGAGDKIDFVVTLGSADGGSFGRLERQAERGTIAIREVAAPKCEEVAEALALSLDLAIGPMQAPAEEILPPPPAAPAPPAEALPAAPALPAEPALPAAPPALAVTAASAATAPLAVPQPAAATGIDDRPQAAAPPPDEDTRGAAAVGAQALLLTGLAPNAMFGGAVSGELALPLGMSARLSGYTAWDQSAIAGAELEHQLFAARLEACSPRLSWSDWVLAGCLGVDGGLLRAAYSGSTGSTDSGPWGAATLLGRAGLRVSVAFTVEAQLGLMLPWVRYQIGDPEGAALARSEAVLATAGLGVSYAFGVRSESEKSARSQVSAPQTAGR